MPSPSRSPRSPSCCSRPSGSRTRPTSTTTGTRRVQPAVYEISIVGPYNPAGAGDTPSRARIFTCRPAARAGEDACAADILSNLMRRAYRRPVTGADLARPIELYRAARDEGGFDAGIEMGLAAVLVSPEFLFRVERDPAGVEAGAAYRLSDLELASRLSFFLWSSIPDGELLAAAERGELTAPGVLEGQVRRMLADPRASNLVTNFAGQWLHPPEPGVDHPGHAGLSRLRRQPAAGAPAGDGDARRERPARGPQRPRPAAGRLHLSERAAREALRGAARLRQPVPPRRVRRGRHPGRSAAPGQHPARDLLCDAHLAGHPGEVGARQRAGGAAPAPASQRAGAGGHGHGGRASAR